ncbi:MarR family winged helix-turn-helix transcriptional regulator [Microbacterium stercoris]|uniref:MarR family transcriptional regulator n=1 Tax=Microbacterium stercoris TaxID=2820289 RepID=A0A939QR69_9MICO|nr:MarR family transcriptional regulator [Microbacterium stercoris]MBO3663146.1 MarR family transcriptional regulator [Microbacterium stercoris]
MARTEKISDDDAIELWGSVIRAAGIAHRRLLAVLRERFGLNEAEVDTMVVLGGRESGCGTMTELARSASFTSGGYTKIADRLCARGLVERTPVPGDRRVTQLILTPEGREMAIELRALTAEINREHFIDVIGIERARLVAGALDEVRAANE